MNRTTNPEPVSRLYRPVVGILDLALRMATRRRYAGLDRIPATGPAVVVCNHLSVADPLVLGTAVHRAGRDAAFLAKAEVFDIPVLGPLLRRTGQIPVHRGSADAAAALEPALAALRSGRLVVIYPEGRITTDPDYRPMPDARTGAVRLALAAGCPVVPVAQWGAHRLVTREHASTWTRPPRWFGWLRPGRQRRRADVDLLVGEPVGVDELRALTDPAGRPDLHAGTALVMRRVGALLDRITAAAGMDQPAPGQTVPHPRERRTGRRRLPHDTAA